MRIAELLTAIATWLESPDNEALCLAEDHEECSKVVAESCVLAAELLKTAAAEVDVIEPAEPSKITPESVEQLADLAAALDASGDAELRKQASVLDELLLTIAAPKGAFAARQDLIDNRLVALKAKYEEPRKELYEMNMIADSEKAIEKSQFTKRLDINQYPLSTRTCIQHPGAQLARIGEHTWRCELDGKVYNYETGYTMDNGDKVPGGGVELQTQNLNIPENATFDTRSERLGQNY